LYCWARYLHLSRSHFAWNIYLLIHSDLYNLKSHFLITKWKSGMCKVVSTITYSTIYIWFSNIMVYVTTTAYQPEHNPPQYIGIGSNQAHVYWEQPFYWNLYMSISSCRINELLYCASRSIWFQQIPCSQLLTLLHL
jgi:hypothetical protein